MNSEGLRRTVVAAREAGHKPRVYVEEHDPATDDDDYDFYKR